MRIDAALNRASRPGALAGLASAAAWNLGSAASSLARSVGYVPGIWVGAVATPPSAGGMGACTGDS